MVDGARNWFLGSLRAMWAPALVFCGHIVLIQTGAYGRHPWLDIPMHWAGGVAIAFFFDHSIRCAQRAGLAGKPSQLLVTLTVFLATCTAAVFWELVEWSFDLYFKAQALTIGDTFLDLIRGIGGGVLYLFATRAYGSPGKDPL